MLEVGGRRRAHHGQAAREERADEVVLRAGVDDEDGALAGLVARDLPRRRELGHADHGHLVDARVGRRSGGDDASAHRPALAEAQRERARVDALEAGDAFRREPPAERSPGGVVAVARDVLLHDEALHLDGAGLERPSNRLLVARGGHARASHERVGEHEDLAAVRGIGEGFDVPRHRGAEDDLTADRARRAEGRAPVARAVLEDEVDRSRAHFVIRTFPR